MQRPGCMSRRKPKPRREKRTAGTSFHAFTAKITGGGARLPVGKSMRGNKTDTLASEEPSVRKRPSQSSEGDTRVIGPVSAETVIKGKWSFRGAELMERRLLVGRRDDRLGGNNYSIRFGPFLINMFLMSLVIKSSFWLTGGLGWINNNKYRLRST